MANLQLRTRAQLLADFDGQGPEQLVWLNLVYTLCLLYGVN